MARQTSCLVAFVAMIAAGCSFGPKALEGTHGKYAASVQKVEEEEFLKNIVRLRYTEEPRKLEVSAIAAQYELTAGAEARPFFSTQAARFANPSVYAAFTRILPSASLGGSNRPTVTFNPQDDGTSVRQFLTPISADTVVFLAQAGWPVSSVLRIWIDRMNGVPNWVLASGPPRDKPADFERFQRVTELLQIAQDREFVSLYTEDRMTELSGPLPAEAVTAAAAVEAAKSGFEYRPREDGKAWALVRRDRRMVLKLNAPGRGSPEVKEIMAILNLNPAEERIELTIAGGVPDPATNPSPPGTAFRLAPRSTAQALFYLANGVDIPPEHVAAGLVRLPADGTDPTAATRGVFHVHCCPGHRHIPPACAYTSIWYRDHWYYIDDRDQESKATLMLMLQLRQLDFKKQEIGRVPALTLPVGR
jgi:hypothetical protein